MQGVAASFEWKPLPDLAGTGASVAAQLGRRIFNRRMAMGISQCELARLVDGKQASVWAMERGDVGCRVDRLILFAKALGTTPSELLEGIE